MTFTPLEAALPLLRRRMPVRAYIGSAEILGTLDVRERAARSACRARPPALALGRGRVSRRAFRRAPYVAENAARRRIRRIARRRDGRRRARRRPKRPLRRRCAMRVSPRSTPPKSRTLPTFARASRAPRSRGWRNATTRSRFGGRRRTSTARSAHELLARVLAHLEALQLVRPWALGVTSLALARELGVDEPLLVRVLAAFVESGRLAGRGGYYATLDHHPALSPEQRALFDELVPRDPSLVRSGAVRRRRFRRKALESRRCAGRARHAALARRASCASATTATADRRSRRSARVETYLRANERMTAAQFRDLLGTSRKYAVPLLEWLDANGVTVRDGDHRTPPQTPARGDRRTSTSP